MLLISREMAQAIVEEIEPVIDESINIIDSDGIIVASSNPGRIGQYHGGAHRVVLERLPELDIEYDGEYAGSLKGVNFPIVVGDETIGVVGITGDSSQVRKLGHIIRKMTEILIVEYDRSNRRLRDEQVRDRFLSDLLFLENLDAHAARAQARVFGIDLKAPACVAVIETMAPLQPYLPAEPPPSATPAARGSGPASAAARSSRDSGTVTAATPGAMTAAYNSATNAATPGAASPSGSGPGSGSGTGQGSGSSSGSGHEEGQRQKPARERLLDEIRWDLAPESGARVLLHGTSYILIIRTDRHPDPAELLRKAKARLEARTGLTLLCGVGARAASSLDLRQSYLSAVKAAAISGTYLRGAVADYETLRIELVVEELPRQLRQDILDRVFRGDSEAERAEWARLIAAYFDLNGSINRMAESLFIHKNTVQYRLSKLKDSTGYDVRKARDAVMLYLAMLFYKSLKP